MNSHNYTKTDTEKAEMVCKLLTVSGAIHVSYDGFDMLFLMFSTTLVQISKKFKSFTVSSVKLMPLSSSF
jgi:hypothetical protein